MTAFGTLVRSRLNPQQETREEKPPSTANAAAFCHTCTHRWHGLHCRTCACPSAWVPPE